MKLEPDLRYAHQGHLPQFVLNVPTFVHALEIGSRKGKKFSPSDQIITGVIKEK